MTLFTLYIPKNTVSLHAANRRGKRTNQYLGVEERVSSGPSIEKKELIKEDTCYWDEDFQGL